MPKFKYIFLACAVSILSLSVLHAQQKPLVVATTSMIADMAGELAGDEFEIRTLVAIGGDPHLYEPTPGDAQLLVKANLILRNGFTLEGWLDELIANSGSKGEVVTVTESVDPIKSIVYKGTEDPHAWMDASKVANGYIKNIKDSFVKLKPDAAEVFNFNYGVYKEQLIDLDKSIMQKIQSIPEAKRVLITSHDAFQYYGKRYGIQLESIIGISTEEEAKSSDIMRVQNIINERKIPAVFVESTINPKMLKQIAKDNEVVIGGELFSDSLGDDASGAGTYYDMMKQNTDRIVNALVKGYGESKGIENAVTKDVDSKSNYLLYGVLALILIGGFLFVAKGLKK